MSFCCVRTIAARAALYDIRNVFPLGSVQSKVGCSNNLGSSGAYAGVRGIARISHGHTECRAGAGISARGRIDGAGGEHSAVLFARHRISRISESNCAQWARAKARGFAGGVWAGAKIIEFAAI